MTLAVLLVQAAETSALRAGVAMGATSSVGNQRTAGAIRPPITAQPGGLVRPRYSPTSLRYVGGSAIQIRGPVTGRLYEFSCSASVQVVDPRDAADLLATSMFRHA
jgi:hypothetical protein